MTCQPKALTPFSDQDMGDEAHEPKKRKPSEGLDSICSELESLTREVDQILHERDTFRKRLANATFRLGDREEKIKRLQSEYDALKQIHASTDSAYLQRRLSQAITEWDRIKGMYDSLLMDIESLEGKIETLTQDLSAEQKENRELQAEISRLKLQYGEES